MVTEQHPTPKLVWSLLGLFLLRLQNIVSLVALNNNLASLSTLIGKLFLLTREFVCSVCALEVCRRPQTICFMYPPPSPPFLHHFYLPHSEDKGSYNSLLDAVKTNYNDRFDTIRKTWGGGIMGVKTQAAQAKLDKLKLKEKSQKM